MNQPYDGQWPMAAKNFASTRFSTLTEINTSDVMLAGCRETPRIAAIATVGDWDRGSSSISPTDAAPAIQFRGSPGLMVLPDRLWQDFAILCARCRDPRSLHDKTVL